MTEANAGEALAHSDSAALEAALLQRRAARLAQPRTQPDAANQLELLCFRVGAERFALPIADLRGVIAIERITRVPGASPDLLGLIHVRGELVPLVDTGRLLRTPIDVQGPPYALLCRSSGKVALGVDEVLGITRLPVAQLRPLEQGPTSEWIEALLPDQTALLRLNDLLATPSLSGTSTPPRSNR